MAEPYEIVKFLMMINKDLLFIASSGEVGGGVGGWGRKTKAKEIKDS